MSHTGSSLIEKLSQIDTPTLSNAVDKREVRNRVTGFANRDLRCWYPEMMIVCGVVITAHAKTITVEDHDGLNEAFVDLCDTIAAGDRRSVVVFQEVLSQPDLSENAEEVMATTYKHYGAVGVVTNAAVRDIHEDQALGFQ